MKCKWCLEVYADGRPDNFGSDPNCAFSNKGVFHKDNWNCAGLHALREAAYDAEVWNEDQHCAVIRRADDCTFIVLSYYKHRGQTEGAWVIDGDVCRVLNTYDVMLFLREVTPGGTE